MKKFEGKTFILLFLIGLTCVPLLSLFHVGFPSTHDGPDHVARIANFFISLSEGNIVPRWASNLNWGYGHPILMFLYPLSSYIASFFILIGFSVIDSTKMVFGVSFVLSALTMYLWVGNVWGKRAGLIAALLYVFAPYRFVDLYVRGAIGEHVAFIFPPLICYFLFKLAKNASSTTRNSQPATLYSIGLTISVAFLILSHNALSLMFLPIIGLYGVYIFFTEAKKNSLFIAYCLLSMFFGFTLSAFFWIPAYFEGKYTLRDIVTRGTVIDRFVSWIDFVKISWNYGQSDTLPKSVGIAQISALITLGFLCIRKWVSGKEKSILTGAFVLLCLVQFIQTDGSAFFWKNFAILQKFQFPWRFLSVTVFLTALIGGISYSILTRRVAKHWSLLFLTVLILGSTYIMWQPKGYITKPESFYTGVYYSTTDTGESSPIWSIRFMEHRPTAPMEIIEGQGQILPTERTTTRRSYEVEADGPTRILENTLYFPGWIVNVDGKATEVEFQDPQYRGLMTFRISGGKHRIDVVFTDTKVRTIANLVSLMSIGALGLVFIGSIIWPKKRK